MNPWIVLAAHGAAFAMLVWGLHRGDALTAFLACVVLFSPVELWVKGDE